MAKQDKDKGKALPPRERRKYPVGVDPRRDERAREADERQAARDKRTTEEQLALLDSRPGESARERERLEAR